MSLACPQTAKPQAKASAGPLVQRKADCCAEETHDVDGVPRFFDRLQTKLAVGARDDAFEHEADAVAQSVIHGEALSPRFLAGGASKEAAPVQRLCAECAEAEAEEALDPELVQRKAAESGEGADNGASPGRSTGAPLAAPVRDRLQSSMGVDLSDVRVHDDAGSRSLARGLNARAFTHGADIWLGPHQSADDVGLMAHEVAHVIQQTSGRATPGRVQRAPADYRHPEDGGGVAGRMQSKIDKAVGGGDDGKGKGGKGGADPGNAGEAAARKHDAKSAASQLDRGEVASKRAEVEPDAKVSVDRAAAEAPKVQEAKAEVQAEADTPGEPIAEGEGGAAAGGEGKGGGKGGEASAAAGAAAGMADAAAGGGAGAGGAENVVVPPAPVMPVDKAGKSLPGDPGADAHIAALAEAAQGIRTEGSRVRAFAGEERANAATLRGNIGIVQSNVAKATQGIAKASSHLDYRREVAGQARDGLKVSEEKAEKVATGAPEYSAKADEGKAESGPMASEAGSLAAENAANTPDDAEAAAKAQEQGGKMNKAGADIGTTDDAVTQTQQKSTSLAQDAAQAKQTNTATRGKLDAMDAQLASTGDKLTTMTEQNTEAGAQAQALASAPEQQTQQANAVDDQGAALIGTSDDMEKRLHAIQDEYAQAMAAVPAEEEEEAPPAEAAAPAEGVVQRTPDETASPIDGVIQRTPDDTATAPKSPDARAAPDGGADAPDAGAVDAGAPEPEAGTEEPGAEAAPEEAAAGAPEAGAEGEQEEEALPEGGAEGEAAAGAPPPPEREKIDLAGGAAKALPSWLTGVETPNEKQRQEAADAAAQRREDQIAEIEGMREGGFASLSATDKMGIALRMTGRNLFGNVGNIKWPGIGHLAVGLIDPRGPLMGVVSGLGMMLSGGANLLSGEQWARDPLGNLLKSAADIATGLTIILGSITALAGVIIAIMTAITIISLGTAAPITGPVIAFCTTVMTTVGGWTIAVGKVALVLQALVFIKNLIDAACASSAAELQSESDQMTENVGDAANVLMQMGMAKASQMGGRAATAEIQAAGGGVRYAAQMGARAGVGARSLLGAAGRGARALPGAAARGVRALPGAIARGAKALPGALGRGARAAGRGVVAGAKALGRGAKGAAGSARGAVGRGLAAAKALPGRALAAAKALPGRALAGAKALPGRALAGVKGLPGKLREGVGKGFSREFLIGEDIASFGGARSAGAEARAAVWGEARAPGGPLAAGAPEEIPSSPSEARAAVDDATPHTGGERDASVAKSSKMESTEITPQQAADEVAHVNEHPNAVEGAPPNQRAKVGDHEIVETPSADLPGGVGCERRSGKPVPLPCPVNFGRPAAKAPPKLTAPQEKMLNRLLGRFEKNGLKRKEALKLLGMETDDELRALVAGAKTEAELTALLEQRAQASGAAARAEAQAQARGEPGELLDEGFDEGSRTLTADEIRELAQSTKPLPTAVEQRMLQDVVDEVSTRLLHDADEAAQWLTPGELKAVHENPRLAPMYFGNAVERAAARRLEEVPALERFLHTPQRPGVSTPDIGGPIGKTGPRAYDITTARPQAIAAHEARSYAPFTELVTYPSLPPTFRFPPPSEVLAPKPIPPLIRPSAMELPRVSPDTSLRLADRIGQGAPLDDVSRTKLEPVLGADLAPVRVHADAHADALARDFGAKAFAAGSDVFFRAGHYAPESHSGERLLAHEIAHTVQQSRGGVEGERVPGGFRVARAGDRNEAEADRVAEAASVGGGAANETSYAASAPQPQPVVQRQPDPGAQPQAEPGAQPAGKKARTPGKGTATTAAEAAAMAPPEWTDYFDEVVPAVIEAAEAHEKVGLQRAMWLIVQAYGEQSPGVTGPPSGHRNRLFNEQGAVTRDAKTNKITGVVPGQESEGVHLYNLKQNESPTRDKQEMLTSPTFGYDTPERAAEHHLGQMEKRWGPAWNALTAEKGSFAEFAHGLKASGYAKAETYDTDLIAIEGQVRRQVAAWIKYRLPEMRNRIPSFEGYIEFMRGEQQVWLEMAKEGDPDGSRQREADRIGALIAAAEKDLEDLRQRTARLERFATVLKVKV